MSAALRSMLRKIAGLCTRDAKTRRVAYFKVLSCLISTPVNSQQEIDPHTSIDRGCIACVEFPEYQNDRLP